MADLFIQSDGRELVLWEDCESAPKALLTQHEAPESLWAHIVATTAFRDDTTEPTDLAVRGIDGDGDEWARGNDGPWHYLAGSGLDWADTVRIVGFKLVERAS